MMRETRIEEAIIAYFDGRLSDHESAELMHRVSVSPEIRQLFREHEMLRSLATSARTSAVVRPQVEDALFSKIAAIRENERPLPPLPVVTTVPVAETVAVSARFWTLRRSIAAALMLGLLGGGALVYQADHASDDEGKASSNSIAHNAVADNAAPTASNAATEATNNATSGASSSATNAESSVVSGATTSIADRDQTTSLAHRSTAVSSTASSMRATASKSLAANASGAKASGAEKKNVVDLNGYPIREGSQSIAENSAQDNAVHTATLREIPVGQPNSQRSLSLIQSLAEAEPFEPSLEVSASTSTGFTYPAEAAEVAPFADLRFSVGYFIGEHSLAGVRINSDLYEMLPDATSTSENGVTVVRRESERQRALGAEAFYSYQLPLGMANGLLVEGTAGAGLIPGGSTLSTELGLKLPFSDRLLAGVSFRLTRVHLTAPSIESVIAQQQSDVIMFEGSDVRNTLNGRVQYGLSYKF